MPVHPSALALDPAELLGRVEPDADAELLARARAQDRAALQTLYARFSPGVGRFLRDLLGEPAAAADATQETFVRAFRKLDTLRDDARLAPWLFGIARHVYLEHRKSRRRESREPVADDARVDGETPESALLGHEVAKVVAAALGALSEDKRTVLLLRIDHHLAYDDIAATMGWSLAKVKVEIHRAREVLRAALARYEEGQP
ncbi:MAG: sigma-70 family RNA polymerase sigma factor [Deltaproteobacteria bacterium]|nr:sigma-70 family RNA polymerase sigma factor [Deltaproteobacteria bacterium]